MNVILSFCACCGAPLSTGLGLEENPQCENCGSSVKERGERIEGDFSESEAARLLEICFG